MPAAVALIAVGLASAAFVSPTQAVVGLKIDFFYLLLPVALLRCPLSAAERDRLVSILMGAAVLTSAYGAGQQLLGAGRLHQWGYEYNTTIRTAGGTLRSFSSFNQPFGFGLFEMLVLLVAVPVALSEIADGCSAPGNACGADSRTSTSTPKRSLTSGVTLPKC